MAKGFKIVEGTAEEVSAEVSRLQAEGWKVKGETIYIRQRRIAIQGIDDATYAQAVIKLDSKDEKEVFGDDQVEPQGKS